MEHRMVGRIIQIQLHYGGKRWDFSFDMKDASASAVGEVSSARGERRI